MKWERKRLWRPKLTFQKALKLYVVFTVEFCGIYVVALLERGLNI
jgi:hypothetical protein